MLMVGLTSVLLAGLSGLRASQTGVATVSQNIANANTPGNNSQSTTSLVAAYSEGGQTLNPFEANDVTSDTFVVAAYDQLVTYEVEVRDGAAYAKTDKIAPMLATACVTSMRSRPRRLALTRSVQGTTSLFTYGMSRVPPASSAASECNRETASPTSVGTMTRCTIAGRPPLVAYERVLSIIEDNHSATAAVN